MFSLFASQYFCDKTFLGPTPNGIVNPNKFSAQPFSGEVGDNRTDLRAYSFVLTSDSTLGVDDAEVEKNWTEVKPGNSSVDQTFSSDLCPHAAYYSYFTLLVLLASSLLAHVSNQPARFCGKTFKLS